MKAKETIRREQETVQENEERVGAVNGKYVL